MFDGNGIGDDVGAKVVKADRQMFRARAGAVVCGDFDAALIVFENGAVHGRGGDIKFC